MFKNSSIRGKDMHFFSFGQWVMVDLWLVFNIFK